MDVSVIIVNYNTRELLCNCIKSIKCMTNNVDYEVIVVDNDSKDNSKEIISKEFPWVKWIQSNNNLGFGKANNLGAKYATGDYLFLLNSDTILQNNAIKIFYDFIKSQDPENNLYGVIGAPLIHEDGTPTTSSGQFISPYNFIKDFAYNIKKLFVHTKSETHYKDEVVDYVAGADMFISKKLYDKIKGFDEDYFMYCEEVDMQLKIHKLGRINHIILGPQIIHFEGASYGKNQVLSFSRYTAWQKSRNIYVRKNLGIFQRLMWYMLVTLYNPIIIFRQDWSLEKKLTAIKQMLSPL